MKNKLGCIALAAAVVTGCCDASEGTRQPGNSAIANPSTDCESLSGIHVSSASIGLPTSGAVLQRATLRPGSDPDGEHCEVIGAISAADPQAPDIRFEVNLPSRWNGKAVQFGGGGYDGELVTGRGAAAMYPTTLASPLKRGYVTLGSDGGHKASDVGWALNAEALANFGHEQVKKTHDVAAAIARIRYGSAPMRFYFIGNSQGGHEALDAAARYPADYDGVSATHPAYNAPMLHLASLAVVQAMAADHGIGWVDPAKHKLVRDLVMSTCDKLDGLADGIISNLPACRATMTITRLRQDIGSGGVRCVDGTDRGDSCLSDAQLDAIRTITEPYAPGVSIAGVNVFPGWGTLEGAALDLGRQNPATSRPDSFFAEIASYTVKYVITRSANEDVLRFDPTQWKDRLQQVGRIMDVSDVDLAPFQAKGGKVLMFHGTADQLIPVRNSEAYYARQLARFGKAKLDAFFRFYVIPGFGHGNGVFNARYDSLTALEDWVERGVEPSSLIAMDENTGATAGRTRPMCVYGTYARPISSGDDPSLASSFRCVSSSAALLTTKAAQVVGGASL